MKIGIDARMYSTSFTGIGRYVHELITNLFKIDKKNSYVIFLNKTEFKKFKCPNKRIKKILANIHHYSISEQTSFLKILKKEKLDLMHFTHFNAPILYRRPCVVTIHDLTLSFFPGKKMTRLIYRMGYQMTIKSITRRAKKIIAVSKNTKKDLVRLLHIPPSKISVIYEAVGREFNMQNILGPGEKKTAGNKFNQNSRLQFSIRKPYFLYTGVWRNHKNIVGLLKAFSLFREKNKNFRLIITGKPDPIYNEITTAVKKLNIKKYIKFTGLVSEKKLLKLYQEAYAYILPSFYEGFGLPILEAFACGIPVLCSNTSSLPETCGRNNALFFNPYNIKDISEKMKRIADNKKLRTHLILRGLKHIKKFSWEKMAKKTLAIYNNIK